MTIGNLKMYNLIIIKLLRTMSWNGSEKATKWKGLIGGENLNTPLPRTPQDIYDPGINIYNIFSL